MKTHRSASKKKWAMGIVSVVFATGLTVAGVTNAFAGCGNSKASACQDPIDVTIPDPNVTAKKPLP